MMFWIVIGTLSIIAVLYILQPTRTGIAEILKSPVNIGVMLAPLIAGGIYFSVGTPEALEAPLASAATTQQPEDLPPDQRDAMIANMVEGLEARLEENPDDIEGWRMLARSYGVLGNIAGSQRASREVINRAPDVTADDWRGYISVLLAGADAETVRSNDDIEFAFKGLFELAPDDPVGLFYYGLIARNSGNYDASFNALNRLREITPDDAPILGQLDNIIEGVLAAKKEAQE